MKVVEIQGEKYFQISGSDAMRPFFMSIVSDSNHWMFISSNGGLTAGRKDAEHALFPYYTDDKITESADCTGSKTLFRINQNGSSHLWEPFAEKYSDRYRLTRNLYKNLFGNKVIFEEINHSLNLVFSYQWSTSNCNGFVRRCTLQNLSDETCSVKILDGIQNILPYGVDSYLQMASSNLADAYKRNELHPVSGLGIYALSAIIVDKAEPSEALKATVAWSLGFDKPLHLLSPLQLNNFRKGEPLVEENDVKGEKGAYFISTDLIMSGKSEKEWIIVTDVNRNHAQVEELCEAIQTEAGLWDKILTDIDEGTRNLIQLVAGADGLQCTGDPMADSRHYANVLFNIMRGGVFVSQYDIHCHDFLEYLQKANTRVYHQYKNSIEKSGQVFNYQVLKDFALAENEPDLVRLTSEYLPLYFSRRHGDPSRPWNKFTINTVNENDGSRNLDYEGNWRDIFQNWEALVHAYPGFIEGMICKFLNASTFDGYNPYRITRDGFDWEIIEPDNPWSYIGYWGDHQIIYLLKFLEFLDRYQPEKLDELLDDRQFVYANVPYRIKPYRDILADAKNTVMFDDLADRAIRAKTERVGADGALLPSALHDIRRVNFMEKILATLLSKFSNFIPEGGIWMNTQRPEWNDANNALVGNGVSVVTLFYTRRFLVFMQRVLSRCELQNIAVSAELKVFFNRVLSVLEDQKHLLAGKISSADRKLILDGLGMAGSDYRETIYHQGFTGEESPLEITEIRKLCDAALEYFEHTIRANKRSDGLYHAYHTLMVGTQSVSLMPLEEMLEGQVAAISSGYPNSNEVAEILEALRHSRLYRADQNSYMLYPNKELPGFLMKNIIPEASVKKSKLLQQMVQENDNRLINKDIHGIHHFNGNFRNAGYLKSALKALSGTR